MKRYSFVCVMVVCCLFSSGWSVVAYGSEMNTEHIEHGHGVLYESEEEVEHIGDGYTVVHDTEADERQLGEDYVVIYETGLDGVRMQENGTCVYEVEHKGSSIGTMEVIGYATGSYDVVVRIVKSGVIGEALFQISLDGGESYIGQDVVTDSCEIGQAGFTLYFHTEQDTTEFVEGDEYLVHVPESFPVIASSEGEANLIVCGHPLEEHNLTITILSSGGLGKSRFTLNSTKGEEMNLTSVIPANGIVELEDGLTLYFSDSEEYERGLTYMVSIRSNEDSVKQTPLYIVLGFFACGVVVAFSVLGSRQETDSSYRLQNYHWRKDEKTYK